MRISVVTPVYNEADNIAPLAAEFKQLLSRLPDLEVLFVDDGSTDDTWERIRDAARQNEHVRGLRTAANHGQSSAMLHGLHAAKGDILVTMDGDLQNRPGDIAQLVEALEGVDVVCGYRATRRDTWSRRIASRVANRVRTWITADGVRDTGCSLKAFHRKCLGDLPFLNGVHRFMPAYFTLNGRSLREVAVEHRPRQHGESKYTNWSRLPRGVLDLFGFWWYRRRYLRTVAVEDTSGI